VNNFKRWGWAGLAAALGVALAGCGGSGDSSGSASLRVANATLTHPSLDLYLNGSASVAATAADAVSEYAAPASGSNTVQLNDNGSGTSLVSSVRTLSGSAHYTLVAYESGGSVKTFVMGEDVAAPASGASLRIFDAAIEAGKIDVYITANACTDLSAISPALSFGSLTSPTPLTVSQGAGTYNVCVTGQGSKSDLRLSMQITLTSQEVATVVLTPASSGGLLVNGALVVQQSTYTAARNTNVRVRLAGAVTAGATVAASATTPAGTVAIDSGNAPLFGFGYTLVPASSALSITSSIGSVAAPSQALVAGSDLTLLVYESGAGPTATLLTDDNRLPTDPTTVKLRLINGTDNGTGAVTLTANNSPVGINVAAGAASDYTTVPGVSNATFSLVLSSSTAGASPASPQQLNPNTVYNVLAVGSFPSPQLLIR
jgi:hypothetical protein